jgi:hypothetical protein
VFDVVPVLVVAEPLCGDEPAHSNDAIGDEDVGRVDGRLS